MYLCFVLKRAIVVNKRRKSYCLISAGVITRKGMVKLVVSYNRCVLVKEMFKGFYKSMPLLSTALNRK